MPPNPFVSALQYVPRIRTPLQLAALLIVVTATGASLWKGTANLPIIVVILLGGSVIAAVASIPFDHLLRGVPGWLKGLIAIVVVTIGGLLLLVITVGSFVLAIGGIQGIPLPISKDNRIVQSANQYVSEERFTDALTELKKASESNYDALTLRGRIYLLMGLESPSYYKQAEEVFEKATKIRPDDGTAWHSLGYARYKLKKLKDARDNFLEAIRLGSDLLGTRYMLGLSHYELGEMDKAETEWRALTKREDLGIKEKYYTSKAHLGLGYVFAKKGDSAAALASIENSLSEVISTGKQDDVEAIRKTICGDIQNPVEPLSHLENTAVFRILMKHVGKGC